MWRKKSLKEKAHQRKLKMTEKTMPKMQELRKMDPSQNSQVNSQGRVSIMVLKYTCRKWEMANILPKD